VTPRAIRILFNAWERQMRDDWLEGIAGVTNDLDITTLSALLEAGKMAEALELVNTTSTAFFNRTWVPAFNESASQASLYLQRQTGIRMVLDQITNFKAQAALQQNGLRLVRGFTAQQNEATMQAIQRSFTTGANPRATARAFRESIGLTARQEAAVANYRRSLESGTKASLGRALRDKRFDRTIDRMVRTGEPLSEEQIQRMTGRYRERMLKYRSETIARTESLRSVHQGQNEMYQQAMDSGQLQPDNTTQEWNTATDERVRDSHSAMHGQVTRFDEPFISGLGNQLMYPGDVAAPAEDTVQCRCAVGTRIKEIVVPAGFSA